MTRSISVSTTWIFRFVWSGEINFNFLCLCLFFCLLGKACGWALIKCWIWAWSVCPKTPCCWKRFQCSKSWKTFHELFSYSWRPTWVPLVGRLRTLCFFHTWETMSTLLRNPGRLLRAATWAVGQHSLPGAGGSSCPLPFLPGDNPAKTHKPTSVCARVRECLWACACVSLWCVLWMLSCDNWLIDQYEGIPHLKIALNRLKTLIYNNGSISFLLWQRINVSKTGIWESQVVFISSWNIIFLIYQNNPQIC